MDNNLNNIQNFKACFAIMQERFEPEIKNRISKVISENLQPAEDLYSSLESLDLKQKQNIYKALLDPFLQFKDSIINVEANIYECAKIDLDPEKDKYEMEYHIAFQESVVDYLNKNLGYNFKSFSESGKNILDNHEVFYGVVPSDDDIYLDPKKDKYEMEYHIVGTEL
jgi:hypothetical protein